MYSSYAAEKTDAFNKLMNTVVSVDKDAEYGYYYITDTEGQMWDANFASNGNIALFFTYYDEYEQAYNKAKSLGIDYAYELPVAVNAGAYRYTVIVPVYKNVNFKVLCARPVYMYPSGEKVILNEQLDNPNGILVVARDNFSYKVRITSGGLIADVGWGQDWVPEEEFMPYNV